MRTDTSEKILEFIAENKTVTVKDLIRYLGFSAQAVHRQILKLLEQKKIVKFGSSPKVFYGINEINRYYGTFLDLDQTGKSAAIVKDFLYVTPSGIMLDGINGFIEWCKKQKLPLEKTAKEYQKTMEKYNVFKKHGLVDGTLKIKETFPKVFLDKLYYLDFYSIERFGKTRLGALVLYAKLNQDAGMISDIATHIESQINSLIEKEKIDAIAYIPHTLPRKVQFLNELAKDLKFNLPKINLVKIKNQLPVAQKTLIKLQDRIQNASETIFVDDDKVYNNILILDDAVGSGASMNETAKKLREKGAAKGKIIGLALTGSYKGFDVLNEV